MELQSFTTFHLAILVLALGKCLMSKNPLLREFNTPGPVTGGLLVCLVATALHVFADIKVGFNLAPLDFS
jgi:ESS family glutamate:Na+ symporter